MDEVVIKRDKVFAAVVSKYLPDFEKDGWVKADEKEAEKFLKDREKKSEE